MLGAMAKGAFYVGFDLGTTNSAAAVFDGERTTVVRNAQGSTLTPSVVRIDPQGRVMIHQRLRDSAQTTGEDDVLGQQNFLEVWNHERFLAKLTRDQFTDEDAKALASFGI